MDTTSMPGVFWMIRKTFLPMRPKPLIAMRMMSGLERSFTRTKEDPWPLGGGQALSVETGGAGARSRLAP